MLLVSNPATREINLIKPFQIVIHCSLSLESDALCFIDQGDLFVALVNIDEYHFCFVLLVLIGLNKMITTNNYFTATKLPQGAVSFWSRAEKVLKDMVQTLAGVTSVDAASWPIGAKCLFPCS